MGRVTVHGSFKSAQIRSPGGSSPRARFTTEQIVAGVMSRPPSPATNGYTTGRCSKLDSAARISWAKMPPKPKERSRSITATRW